MSSMKQKAINVLAVVGTIAIVLGIGYFFFGNHGFWAEGGESFGDLWHEKGHWYLELAVGSIQVLVIDVFFGLIVWRLVIRPHIHRDIEHADHDHEVDEDHDTKKGR